MANDYHILAHTASLSVCNVKWMSLYISLSVCVRACVRVCVCEEILELSQCVNQRPLSCINLMQKSKG